MEGRPVPITSYSHFGSLDFRYPSPQVPRGKADTFEIGNSVTVPCTVPTDEEDGGGAVGPYVQGLMAQSAQVSGEKTNAGYEMICLNGYMES